MQLPDRFLLLLDAFLIGLQLLLNLSDFVVLLLSLGNFSSLLVLQGVVLRCCGFDIGIQCLLGTHLFGNGVGKIAYCLL
jgi:hypothetical protein